MSKILRGWFFFLIFVGNINLNSQNNNVGSYAFDFSQYQNKIDFSLLPSTSSISTSIEIDKLDSDTQSCKYQNQYLTYGTNILPKISDSRRVNAIIELVRKIIQCLPLPFKEDGQTFLNKEGRLPQMPKGYYQEYTLIVPKDADKEFYVGDTHYTAYPSYGTRGPERLVIGGGKTIYYTPTHYDNFVVIELVK
ncbi:MAG: hypothetical protein K6357_06055 [Elusimicrobiota bacterium]